ncbi:hypothetical protein FHX42_003608 [Saccharopolyspora lacisalsi]|uniref:Uncharacterized protein n=1 Tax=Halosaccharopolyspora lacisalsi TaxID=1000566 RepID=A0A839DW94_9PSEU|nr:hypothetical protein [Halosaccharopolyspora lacisalsi]MBA8826232.1 hypothetical protein [Halosaccharopolyspora lacisalsi]
MTGWVFRSRPDSTASSNVRALYVVPGELAQRTISLYGAHPQEEHSATKSA